MGSAWLTCNVDRATCSEAESRFRRKGSDCCSESQSNSSAGGKHQPFCHRNPRKACSQRAPRIATHRSRPARRRAVRPQGAWIATCRNRAAPERPACAQCTRAFGAGSLATLPATWAGSCAAKTRHAAPFPANNHLKESAPPAAAAVAGITPRELLLI